MRRPFVLLLAFAFAGAACSGDDGPGGTPAANEVWMQGSTFTPSPRVVASGTQVTFVNQDGLLHNITTSAFPAGGTTISTTVTGGASFNATFTVTGAYQYFCNIHGTATTGMRGTINVN